MAKKKDEKLKKEENTDEVVNTADGTGVTAEPDELEKAQALAEDYKRKWYSVSA